jgi:hypothetical protein
MNGDNGVERIVLAAQQRGGLEVLKVVIELSDFCLEFLLNVLAFPSEIEISIDVGKATRQQAILLDSLLETFALGEQLLGGFGIFPKARPSDLLVAGLKFAGPSRSVKENSVGQRRAAADSCIRVPVLRSRNCPPEAGPGYLVVGRQATILTTEPDLSNCKHGDCFRASADRLEFTVFLPTSLPECPRQLPKLPGKRRQKCRRAHDKPYQPTRSRNGQRAQPGCGAADSARCVHKDR